MTAKQPQTTAPSYPAAPSHLSQNSRELWNDLGWRYAKTPARRALLQAGLEARDRAEQARGIIADAGLTAATTATGTLHIHPLAKLELECRKQFASIFAQLGLNEEARW